jgi:uncharacterized membrane protein YoaK (UPF0700 family)
VQQLDRPRRHLAIALAALAGYVDAIAFLSAGGYFASFMSGNTTRLGVDLATHTARAAIPLALIAGFVIGVAVGALVAETGGGRRKTRVLALCAALLALAAAFDSAWQPGFLGASVLAMGALNNVFRRNGEVAVGVTYMTGALVRLGQGLAARAMGRESASRLSAGLLWLGLAAGATAGALVYETARVAAPWIAFAGALALLLAAWRIERAPEQAGDQSPS